MFPAMEMKGFSRNEGPLSVMLYEHTVGRDAVQGMEQAIDRHVNGVQGALSQFVSHANRYMNVLRQHIEKEDHCLFSMEDHALSSEEQAELLNRFAEAEREMIDEATKDRYRQMAERLANRYQVDSAAVPVESSGRSACGSTSCQGE